MSLPILLDSFQSSLAALQRLLDHFNNQGVIIGGIAVSLLAEPRFTADADAVILLATDDLPRLLDLARQEGLVPRIDQAEQFARRNRVLLLRHTESEIDVDISLGLLPFEIEMVERSKLHQAGSLKLRLPTPEDLLIMKAIAHRPKDLIDIESIINSYPNLDRKRVQFWVEQFAEALETPELWDDVARLLRKTK
ncbi:MAG: nucleotidyl transferase AbiEii/AbiGii toxin family protein [Chloroflexi bacterium]|nr:nucleotidyl transferase AbiEii/AbiGii toxin family protein [Chloroflexota bacterium]